MRCSKRESIRALEASNFTTDEAGRFKIEDVASGTYEAIAVVEKQRLRETIVVEDADATDLTLFFR